MDKKKFITARELVEMMEGSKKVLTISYYETVSPSLCVLNIVLTDGSVIQSYDTPFNLKRKALSGLFVPKYELVRRLLDVKKFQEVFAEEIPNLKGIEY